MEIVGRRINSTDDRIPCEQDGDYGRDGHGRWFGWVPGIGDIAPLHLNAPSKAWNIEEHEDGTISVTPSILRYGVDGKELWHGYLTRGVWRTC